MFKLTAAVGLLLALAACADHLPPPVQVSNRTLPAKTALDVRAITLADRSAMQPASSPYNSNHFTPTIDDAIKQWATDRLQAAGPTGQAIVLIKDASLTAQPLSKKSGVDGWFTRQQAVKYIGHAEVSVEANGRPGYATADASATRVVTLPENPTPMEKQDAYYSLLNGLMKDLGQNLDAAIQSHMNSFIITAPVFGTTAVPSGSAMMPASEPPLVGDPVVDAGPFALPPAPPAPMPVAAPLDGPAMSGPYPAAPQGAATIPLSGPGR